jgi:hypothetical protein
VEKNGQSASGSELLSLYVAQPKPQPITPEPDPLPSRESLARDVN